MIIDELLVSEDCEFKDIKIAGSGAYSTALQIGDSIFKIGMQRNDYYIPNHKRILQPIIRRNLNNNSNISFGTIEITQKVKTNLTKEEITEDMIYELYKELRLDGIVCDDLKKENLGILLKENKTYIDNKETNPDAETRGFDRNLKKEEILLPGDFVIIDTDYLRLADPRKQIIFGNRFEKRYLKEMKSNKITMKDILDNCR